MSDSGFNKKKKWLFIKNWCAAHNKTLLIFWQSLQLGGFWVSLQVLHTWIHYNSSHSSWQVLSGFIRWQVKHLWTTVLLRSHRRCYHGFKPEVWSLVSQRQTVPEAFSKTCCLWFTVMQINEPLPWRVSLGEREGCLSFLSSPQSDLR